METTNPMEFFRNLPPKKRHECGEQIVEQAESYFMECHRCLSKREEY